MKTENTNNHNLRRDSMVSVLSLFFQSGYAAFLGLVANLVLTVLLTPRIFGIYFTVLSVIALLNYFSDIGLAASLIQKKDLKDEDIKTTFTVQQILIITLILIGYFGTGFVRRFYDFPDSGIYLYWSLLAGFFLSSLKTIPSIFLERSVQFQKIVLVQVVENTVFYASVIICAISGLGLNSFTVSVILRSISGLVLMYIISPWRPEVGISRASLKTLLSYGVPFQASSFLALFKDDLITLYLGKVLGFEALGYIGWAKKWAEAPIRIIMDNVTRVLFPVISRMQGDKEKISKVIEKILHYQSLILAPALFGLAVVMRPLVEIIPRYGKWAPAVPLFYIFVVAAYFSTYSTPFINLFNALGKVKISLLFMIVWTVTTWICTPLFTYYFGYFGFPLTQLILAATSVLVMLKARTVIKFSPVKQIAPPFISAVIMALISLLALELTSHSIMGVVVSVLSGAAVYYLMVSKIFKINIIAEIRSLMRK